MAPRRRGKGKPGYGPASVGLVPAVRAGLLPWTAGPAAAAAGDLPSVTLPGARMQPPRDAGPAAADGTGYPGSWPSAALWGSTLWRPGTAPGTVSAVSLPSLKAGPTESVGATCVPKDLQVVGRWIYWSCGPDGAAGAYDRTGRKLIHVPSGYAQLADGYLGQPGRRGRAN